MEPNSPAAQNDPDLYESMTPDPVPPPADEIQAQNTGLTLSQYGIMVAVGAFVTTFAQQRILGQLPTTFLLKDTMHLKKEAIAFFFFVATFAWNIKPIAGIFTDAFPLLGTRRRSYMLFGSILTGICWFLMGGLNKSVDALMYISIAVNVGTVVSSTVMGGLMVEAGQAFSSPGRISSLRQAVQSVAQIGGPMLGGFLAGKAFGWSVTTTIAGVASLGLAAITFVTLKEPKITKSVSDGVLYQRPTYRPPVGLIAGLLILGGIGIKLILMPEFKRIGISLLALHSILDMILIILALPISNQIFIKAQNQLVQILNSRTLWLAVAMLFLIYTVPGFNTALIFQQTDVFKMDPQTIGNLSALEGVFGLVGAALYALYCKKLNLKSLIIIGVGLNAAFTLLYLKYSPGTAMYIHSVAGFVVVLSELSLMDLAVRSTPRGCEALGFALMMSIRNFGIALSDILGSNLMDVRHLSFNSLIWVNAITTAVVLLFIPILPRAVLSRKEGE